MSALPVPAIASYNTQLWLGGPTSPPSYVEQGRIGNLDFPGVAIDTVDVTNQQSTAHRFLGTLLNPGSLTFDLFWEPKDSQDQTLFNLVIAAPPVLQQWKVIFAADTDATAWFFNGYLEKFPAKADIGKALMAQCSIKIDGAITVVYGV